MVVFNSLICKNLLKVVYIMFYSIKDSWRRFLFDFSVREVLHTPPVQTRLDSPAVILTQLQHKDVKMFLLACKSFTCKISVSRIFILSDGSLTNKDRVLLRQHIPGVFFLELAQFRSQRCPAGACWERILAISNLVADHYVIQLDGDTLTMDDLEEVGQCVSSNLSFTLGTDDGQVIQDMQICSAAARSNISGANLHVQSLAEANFSKLSRVHDLKYVRGCAGFAGFARGSFSSQVVEQFSTEIEELIGARWHEWGSEQVMSNIIVSNSPGAIVLPHPKYGSCELLDSTTPNFVHFIGYCRFKCGHYSRLARSFIRAVRAYK